LDESPSTPENRIILIGKLIDALESDAAWVELYGITGELVVPGADEETGEIRELLTMTKKVQSLWCNSENKLPNIVPALGRSQTLISCGRKVERNSDPSGCPIDECERTPESYQFAHLPVIFRRLWPPLRYGFYQRHLQLIRPICPPCMPANRFLLNLQYTLPSTGDRTRMIPSPSIC
jgi:hypothetical protein